MGANEGRSALIPSGNRCLDGEMVSACHERWLTLAEDIECWLAQGLSFSELRTIMLVLQSGFDHIGGWAVPVTH